MALMPQELLPAELPLARISKRAAGTRSDGLLQRLAPGRDGFVCGGEAAAFDAPEGSLLEGAREGEGVLRDVVAGHQLVEVLVRAEGADDGWVVEVAEERMDLVFARGGCWARWGGGGLGCVTGGRGVFLFLAGRRPVAEINHVVYIPQILVVQFINIIFIFVVRAVSDNTIARNRREGVEGFRGSNSWSQAVSINGCHTTHHEICRVAEHRRHLFDGPTLGQ